jgi:hypothetical protein
MINTFTIIGDDIGICSKEIGLKQMRYVVGRAPQVS